MTPGSFNTTLGVVRTVREHLKPYDEVFIVEMGAKQPGDIKEIADLVHPRAAIITAVGEQHLETFKTVENVQKTKFELVDALPADGFAVLNNDFPYVASRKVGNVEAVRYAVSNPEGADYRAEEIRYTSRGTTFSPPLPYCLAIVITTFLFILHTSLDRYISYRQLMRIEKSSKRTFNKNLSMDSSKRILKNPLVEPFSKI